MHVSLVTSATLPGHGDVCCLLHPSGVDWLVLRRLLQSHAAYFPSGCDQIAMKFTWNHPMACPRRAALETRATQTQDRGPRAGVRDDIGDGRRARIDDEWIRIPGMTEEGIARVYLLSSVGHSQLLLTDLSRTTTSNRNHVLST